MKHAGRLGFLLVILYGGSLALAPGVRADTLRGFGAVTPSALPDGQGMRFACDSPAHAVQLIHKLARDMALSVTVPSQWTTVALGGRDVPVLVRPGLGAYLVLAQGQTAYCFTAPLTPGQDTGSLAAAFAPAAPLLPGAQLYDSNYTYPVYLDKWSTAGIGTWYTPFDPFDDDPKGMTDVVNPHFQYMTDNHMTVHVGVLDAGWRETMYFIRKYNRPWHLAQWHEWSPDLARLDPFDLTQPSDRFSSWASYYGQLSQGGDRLHQYRDWKFQQLVRACVSDPLLVDWDEPHGEIGPGPWQIYWDYGPENRAHFVRWLQTDRGYTLASLGQAWYHDAHHFSSWDQVPIPFDYSLLGVGKDSLLADRTWRLHTGDPAAGLAAHWQAADFDDSQWAPLTKPGGELGALEIESHRRFWYRGTITVPAAYLAAHPGPLYLVCAPMDQGGGPHNPSYVWLNGVDLGGLSSPGGFWTLGSKQAAGLIHAGVNHVAYCPPSTDFSGAFFLSPEPLERYPFGDSGLNARSVDWREYVSAGAVEQETHTLQTIRGTDPNRPIKIMAAGDKDLFNEVMADYGGFPHNTGDEAFFGPWDRRGGYLYGIPGSAEPSASMVTADNFHQWQGWFTFECLNAFDNFIDVEAMMYTPVTPLWKESLPYLHLANRYDLKKPEVALFSSGETLRLNPGAGAGMPYIFDLGRGDLQSLGYSYVELTERALHRGLAAGYPVLWDCGTWVMSPQTVADLTKYVENGGTFVALQETGRNTLIERDAWPIEKLTGFHVSEIRPMGGFLSILYDQPLFTKLAGRNFENEGRSIDYSGYNYADKCLALTPVAPGTQAIARYRDGAIAIGMRRLGKGRVIVLGSPFWRDSYDKRGMWWPGPTQNAVVQDLLEGLGVPPDVPADTTNVWRDRYVANNGTEEYLILWNPSDTDAQKFTTDWQTSFPAAQVYDPKTGQPVAAQIDGAKVHLTESLQPLETRILAVQSQRAPADTLTDWWTKTAQWWHASLPGRTVSYPALPVFYATFPPGAGKIVDTASVTPEFLSSLSSRPASAEGWDRTLGMIAPWYDGIATHDGQSVLYRSTVATPPSWRPDDRYIFRLKRYPRGGFSGVVYFNGKQIATSRDPGETDVSALLHFGGTNVLVIAAGKDGFVGDPDLWRKPAAAETLDLKGLWQVRLGEDTGTGTATLPGSFTGLWASRSVVVPAAWSKFHVFLNAQANYRRVAINDRVIFYDADTTGYMDVTPWIKFGQPNQILLQPGDSAGAWKPGQVTVGSIVLERVDPAKLQPVGGS